MSDTGAAPPRSVGDTGGADPRLAAALARLTATPGTAARAEVLAALVGARVFAPVTARSTAEHVEEHTGLRAESSAEMVLLSLVGSAGGRAVPLFVDAAGAVGFRAGARPVPLPGPDACAAALQDGAAAVLLDPPGAALALTGPELQELALGRVPVAGAPLSTARTTAPLTAPSDADPDLLARVADALQGEPVQAARLLQGPDGPVLGVVPQAPLDAAALAALAARVLPSVGVADLALAVVAPGGPGLAVPLRQAPGRRSWWRLRPDR